MGKPVAVRFGTRWVCQLCGETSASEWAIWCHVVETHPQPGPGQRLAEALIAAFGGPWR